MNMSQRADWLHLLKTLADENRLTMVALMSERERTVRELAGLLGLSEPTISHHVGKLRGAGLLLLRMAGSQHFYRLNPARVAQFKSYAAALDTLPTEAPPADNAWIESLDVPEADKKVLRTYLVGRRLTQFPNREKRWLVILRWLVTLFEPGVRYTEREVNTILTAVHEDYALMRRDLVEYGFMRRERGGGDYWLAPENETAPPQPPM
jgi:biotin operon repressor